MRTRDVVDLHAAFRQFAPAEIFLERTQQWLTTRAKQRDRAAVRPFDVFHDGADMDFPQFQFVFGKMDGVNDLFDIHGRSLAPE